MGGNRLPYLPAQAPNEVRTTEVPGRILEPAAEGVFDQIPSPGRLRVHRPGLRTTWVLVPLGRRVRSHWRVVGVDASKTM